MRPRYRFRVMILIGLLIIAPRSVKAQSLNVRLDGVTLRVDVARVRLLTGDPLQRLRDGASVTYVFQLSALGSRAGSVLTKTAYRFVISYDIFEERFQISRLQPSPLVLSHLTMSAAEAAMLEAMELPTPAIDPGVQFWVRWEYRAEEAAGGGSSGITLGNLVDIFSRRDSRAPVAGAAESGPFRLREMPRTSPTRGPANP